MGALFYPVGQGRGCLPSPAGPSGVPRNETPGSDHRQVGPLSGYPPTSVLNKRERPPSAATGGGRCSVSACLGRERAAGDVPRTPTALAPSGLPEAVCWPGAVLGAARRAVRPGALIRLSVVPPRPPRIGQGNAGAPRAGSFQLPERTSDAELDFPALEVDTRSAPRTRSLPRPEQAIAGRAAHHHGAS